MDKLNYNFTGLNQAMLHLIERPGSSSVLKEIQNELNKFFKDSKCEEVIYTRNTDNIFFGMSVYAVLGDSAIDDILNDTKSVRIGKYYIEIDSKLLEIGLTNRELAAVLLHEVGHLVNDSTPAEKVRAAVDLYMAKNKTVIDLKNSRQFNRFLGFAIRDSIRKFTSLFTRNDEEILADEFVFLCGYGEYLESAYRKIRNSSFNLNKNVPNKLIALDWSFQIYKNMGTYRLVALRTLNKAKSLTGSKLEQKEIEKAIDELKKVDDDIVRECYSIGDIIKVNEQYMTLLEQEAIRNNGLIRKIQMNGLRGIEEDVYEYQMRIRNIEDESEAISLMRQLNTRMAVLDDYLLNATDLTERERERWEKAFSKYDLLRDELSRKTVYNRKNYGLWFDYNYLDNNR